MSEIASVTRQNITGFKVDSSKCTGCGICTYTCVAQLLSVGEDGLSHMKEVDCFGWDGCWKCQHCLAVCPEGAISIFGRDPADSLLPADPSLAAPMLDALIANRRSHRRFLDKDVDEEVIESILISLQNVPSGGDKMQTEYTLLADRETTEKFRQAGMRIMEKMAQEGKYPETFDEKSLQQMKDWTRLVRPDMLFCGAPHLLIFHSPGKVGCWQQDPNIAAAYFELLCASRGLGAVMMSFPVDLLIKAPELLDMVQIPRDHYIPLIVGFGYPEITYARGVQKRTAEETRKTVHRIKL